jgi:hypothetical protein
MPPEALQAADGTTFTTAELLQHWRLFSMWAEAEGVSLAHAGDYLPWWECYLFAAFQENQRT